ncbi:hypothetical protein [Streptomyces sp. NPDC048643]|uniref:hypothetical protein n=1 Tax=Streptomyces sp. NPDC048643 TaxID=3155637 RepID=UPI00341F5C1E
MEHQNTPDAARESGLSTDDLAQPREDRGNAPGPSPDAPAFPGEATATPDHAAGRDATGPDARTRTSSDAADAQGGPNDSDVRDGSTGRDAEAAATQPRSADRGDVQDDESPQLLSPQDEETFRGRWQEVQSKFVDDPRDAVHGADALVADVMQRLAATFADQKQELEGQWNRGEQADTEDLRLALRHYRSFFNRLLVT